VLALSLALALAPVLIPPFEEATDLEVVIHIGVAREEVFRLDAEAIVVSLAPGVLSPAVRMDGEDVHPAMKEVDAGDHTVLAPSLALLVHVLRHILDDDPTLVPVRGLPDRLLASAALILAAGVGAEVVLPVALDLCRVIGLVRCLVHSHEAEAIAGVGHEAQICQLAVAGVIDRWAGIHPAFGAKICLVISRL